jgi:hypothetical protein
MSKNIKFVLIYHCHKLLDLILKQLKYLYKLINKFLLLRREILTVLMIHCCMLLDCVFSNSYLNVKYVITYSVF